MNDSDEALAQGVTQAAPWLLLIHQVPPKPDYLRVKIRRRLQRLGSIALKSTVYVLPASDQALEDFQWLRREIVGEGGEATLCEAAMVEGMSDPELHEMFRRERDAEYAEIVEAAGSVGAAGELPRLRRMLSEAVRRDFFAASGRSLAERVLGVLEARMRGDDEAMDGSEPENAPSSGATWVTRTGVRVDRIASAWLIRRFVDRAARFKFVPPRGYEPLNGELRFDMFEGEFTHDGELCTFEVLTSRYARDDAALRAVGEVVHDLDCHDGRYSRAETPGVGIAVDGVVAAHPDDDEARISSGAAIFEGLYAHFRRASVE